MALIACHECGKEISDKAAACPHCGALAAAPAVSEREQYAAVFPDGQKKPTSIWPALISMAVLAVIVVSCVNLGGSGSSSSSSFGWNDALTMCQSALKKASRDPDKAEVPYVENQGSGDNYYFIWGPTTKMARMRNGLGLEVATSASCTVSGTQKRITSLILDGQAII